MTVTIDPDYEQMTGNSEWQIQYWWPDRAWRWVKTSRVEFGREVAPADPEAAMEPDDSLIDDQYRKCANTLKTRTDLAVLSCLRQRGAMTVAEIVAAIGLSVDTVRESLARRPDLFAHDNRFRNRQWRSLGKLRA